MCERNMTNRERLEKMTNEELAKWLCDHFNCEDCPIILPDGIYFCAQLKTNKLLDWLKAEAEEES